MTSMKARLTALVLAGAIALGGVAPAQASERSNDVAGAIAGAIALGLIINGIDKGHAQEPRRHVERRAPQMQFEVNRGFERDEWGQKRHHRRAERRDDCVRVIETRRGYREVLSEECLMRQHRRGYR